MLMTLKMFIEHMMMMMMSSGSIDFVPYTYIFSQGCYVEM